MDGLPRTAALIVIDVQKGFDDPCWGPRNNPLAEVNLARLLQGWRATRRPVFHAQHMSRNPGSPLFPGQAGNEIKDAAKPLPDEPVVTKSVNSAFIGTDLEARLRAQGVEAVVVAGITTNHCVSTTARMAGNLGFATFVVSDACATFDMKGHDGRHYPAEEMPAGFPGLTSRAFEHSRDVAGRELAGRLDDGIGAFGSGSEEGLGGPEIQAIVAAEESRVQRLLFRLVECGDDMPGQEAQALSRPLHAGDRGRPRRERQQDNRVALHSSTPDLTRQGQAYPTLDGKRGEVRTWRAVRASQGQ